MTPFTTIAILEDDPASRAALVDAAAECGEVIWQAGTIADAAAQLAVRAPDIMLVDLGLPDGDGIEFLAKASKSLQLQCLVISMAGDEATVLRAIENGAIGYLLKDQSSAAVVAAIREVIAGGSPITPRLAMYLLKRLRTKKPSVDSAELLTHRELEILDGLARGSSYAELAAAKHVSYHTINTHVKSIYRKLAVRSRTEAVFKAVSDGIVRLH